MGNRFPRPVALLLGLLTACGGSQIPEPEENGTSAKGTVQNTSDSTCTLAEADEKGVLHWFDEDQFEQAMDCAIMTGKPLAIDLWAPWCHTCLSMQQTVLVDPSMKPLSDRFVWLRVDTDKPAAAPILELFPVQAWPTFYVAAGKEIANRFVGSASTKQFREFLVHGERITLAKRTDLPEGSPILLVRDGYRAEARGDLAAADKAYGAALAKAPRDWSRRPDVLVSRIGVLYEQKAWTKCAALAAANADQTGTSASAPDFAYYAMACAKNLDDAEAKKALLVMLAQRVAAVVGDATAPLSADDRSDGLRILRELKESLGDETGAKEAARRQQKLLDEAAAAAPTPFAAMTFNWPRSEVYVYLDEGEKLVGALEQSVRDLPKEYDPPYRLAWVLLQIGKPDEALKPAEAALGLVYGPRKGRVQSLVAEIHRARGDREAEIAARKKVVEIYEGLPDGQKSERAIEAAKAALEEAKARETN